MGMKCLFVVVVPREFTAAAAEHRRTVTVNVNYNVLFVLTIMTSRSFAGKNISRALSVKYCLVEMKKLI